MEEDFISVDQLPLRAALDTGVMARGFWPLDASFADDSRTVFCHAFVRSMLDSGRTILISAISIAEALRFPHPRKIPRVRGIQVVAFDAQAAMIFGDRLQEPTLKDLASETGGRRQTMTVDAMIAACAARARADMIISIDRDFVKLGSKVGIAVKGPDAFQVRQTKLNL